MKRRVALLFLLCLFAYQATEAQKIGKPFVQTYPAKVYGGAVQNWGIGQDYRGVMYFANDQGVLEYDGRDWRQFNLPNDEPVRSLRISEEGIVYVGGVGEFGYLAPTKIGGLQFTSLKHLLPDTLRFEDIWSIQVTPEMVYFQTDSHVFGYKPYTQEKIKIWNPLVEGSDFFLTFYVHKRLFVHSRKAGLFTLEDGILKLANIGMQFSDARIYAMLPLSSTEILIGSREKGLFIYEHRTSGKVSIEPLVSEAHDFIMKQQLYKGIALPDGNVVLCTRKGGAIVSNRYGKIIEVFNKNTGLTDENIRDAYLSADNILWFALDNGINHVSYRCPIRTWDETRGIRGTVRDIQTFGGQTYLATSLGVFILNKNTDSFEPLQNISTESWKFCMFQSTYTQKLLVGTNEGVFDIQGTQAQLIKGSKKAVRSFVQSIHTPTRLYVGLKGGLLSLRYTQGAWIDEGDFQGVSQEIISLIETADTPTELWASTFTEGIYKIYLEKDTRKTCVKPYQNKEGLPTLRESHLYKWQDTLYVASPEGLFAYSLEKDKFEISPLWAKQFPNEKRGAHKLLLDAQKNMWVTDHNTRKHSIGSFRPDQNGGYTWREGAIKRLPEFSEPSIYVDGQNALWVGGTDGLYRYDVSQLNANTPPFRALIREIKIQNDSVVFGGIFFRAGGLQNKQFLKQQDILKIPAFDFHEPFEISFQCAAPFYDVENRTTFSYFLEGYEKHIFGGKNKDVQWSAWTRESKRTYTNLSEGTYCFYVKARNVYGEESLLASYRFRIYAPWYRTLWAYMLYLVISVTLIYIITNLYTRNLRTQKERLEQIVTARTRELIESAKKLELTHQLLVRHNTDLNDSIDYASRIQRVMLPKVEHIKTAFPESFILWKPLQKVSGDFYWFAETNMEPRFAKDALIENGMVSIFKGFVEGKKIIAAIDCTGHGIPGAFMSMMGDAYLNQIVNNEGITQPQLILHELDILIRHALKQDDGGNADGMDMAMCVVNPNQNIIEFSGAKNGIIYVKAGEATLIRGDRFSIGGANYEDEEKNFTRHIIPIDQTTNFYLYSDGLPDQFGGDRAKKFSSKQMQAFFATNAEKGMQEQFELLQQTVSDWMADYEQIDDILVIGVKVEVN